jgi:hypothetical protein
VFDPISWVFGFGLTKAANRTFEAFSTNELSKALDREVRMWAAEVSREFEFEPAALFSQAAQATEKDTPSRQAMRQSIESQRVPSVELWYSTLFERWLEVRTSLGDEAQEFFRADETSVKPLLQNLAERLYRICAADTNLFRNSTYKLVATLYDKIENVEQMLQKRSLDKKNSPLESVSSEIGEIISISPNNAMGHNVALGARLRTDATFIVRLMFYLRCLQPDSLRRLDVRYHVQNSDRVYPPKVTFLAIDGEKQRLNADGILEPLYQITDNRWHSVVCATVYWALDSEGNVVFPSHPEFGDPDPPQDGTDYGRGQVAIELMERERIVPFFLNPGGKMLLSPDGWHGPGSLID